MNINDTIGSAEYEVTEVRREVGNRAMGMGTAEGLAFYLKETGALDPEPTKVVRILIDCFEDVVPPEDPPEE